MHSIYVNQIGYRPDDAKRAAVVGTGARFSVLRADDGTAVYEGALSDERVSAASGEKVRVADFSALTKPGKYVLAADESRSQPFAIAADVYAQTRRALLDFYHFQKCGVDLNAGAWSHAACHTGLAQVLDADGNPTGEVKDVTGGWHDAGDYGRYIVPAAQTVAQLLLGYELSPNPDADVPDIVWFELEWMLKMQDEASGGVYHKVSCPAFNPPDEMPDDEKHALVLSPVSAAATADFAAATAMAARFYPAESKRLLNAARAAWDWCAQNPDAPGFANPPGVTTGGYGDRNSADERFWAACEWFATTGDADVHDCIKSSALYDGLGWNRMGTYGLFAYLTAKNTDAAQTERMRAKLEEAAREVFDRYRKNPYGHSLGKNYPWGSNMNVGNNAMTLLLADRIAPTPGYAEAALAHIHYLLGRNPMGISYVTGHGAHAAKHPHHRPSMAQQKTVPGMVVGGPCGNTRADAKLQASCTGQPPAKCYVDHHESYASNEVTIYWNSPMYAVMAMLGL